MGLPSGVMWAPCNIDVEQPGGFAKSPFQYECSYFSWGNVDGHNPTGPASFLPWSWGSANPREPWYDGQVYGNTPGNTLTNNIPVGGEFDAARANLGTPWRLPTNEEFIELFENVIYINADGSEVDTSQADKRVTVDGVVGIYLQSTINGARLFLACEGYGNVSSLIGKGQIGGYWSSTINNSRYSYNLGFSGVGVRPEYRDNRHFGFAIRPVMKL